MGVLKNKIIKVSEIDEIQINQMFLLMDEVYFGVNQQKFKNDLKDKNYLLLLEDNNGVIQGFTTIKIFESAFQNKPVKIIYSGDTVISENCRGEIELMRAWWRFSYQIQKENVDMDVYWMLISKGWRTYKFFPLFLKDFYPNKSVPTPDYFRYFIDKLGEQKFGNEYKNGIIRQKDPDFLKVGKNDVPEHKKSDEDVQFFLKTNPEFYEGNELVCVAKLHPDNLTKAGLRLLHGMRNG